MQNKQVFNVDSFRALTQRVIRAEKPGSYNDWTPEQRKAYESGNWRQFSELRGYSEQEINDYNSWLLSVQEAISEGLNPFIFISDLSWQALKRNLDLHGTEPMELYLHKSTIINDYDISTIHVFDDFLENPEQVRQSAIESGFDTWRPNRGEVGSSVYTGINFVGDHATCLRALKKHLGYHVYPNSMFFRVTNEDTEAAYVHSDRSMGDFSCILYLSNHGPESGTGFYKHKLTEMTHMPSYAELRDNPVLFDLLKQDMVEAKQDKWEEKYFVEGKYNRCLVFDAPRLHSRKPRHGYGLNIETGRLIWGCHFNRDK